MDCHFLKNRIIYFLSTSHKSKYIFGYNDFGHYCLPKSSIHRPACQTILKGEIHEPDTILYIAQNYKDGDIIHAGTYFGDFLPSISKVIGSKGKIWSFEPNNDSFKCAQITILLNDLINIEIFNNALGEYKSTAYLKIKENNLDLGGACRIDYSNCQSNINIPVNIVSIDEIIPNDRNISIIQIDVEGYEEFALKGAIETIKRCKPILIFEDNNEIRKRDWFQLNILKIGYNFEKKVHENYIFKFNH